MLIFKNVNLGHLVAGNRLPYSQIVNAILCLSFLSDLKKIESILKTLLEKTQKSKLNFEAKNY